MRHHLVLLFSLSIAAGCTQSGNEAERTQLGKADAVGSCKDGTENLCGGPGTGNCWCNEACVEFGDCCSDYQLTCAPDPATRLLGELSDLIAATGATQMPPVAVKHWANELEVTAEVVTIVGENSEFLHTRINALADEYRDDSGWYEDPKADGFFALAMVTDGAFRFVHDYGTAASGRKYIVESLLTDEHRAAIEAKLPAHAHYAWFQVYDIGAEIYGKDIIIVMPYGSKVALVVTVVFVHA